VVVNACTPSVPIVAVAGLTDTDVRAMIVITVGALCLTTPLRVALTKSPTVPAVSPAVNVTPEPEGVRVPIALLLSVHEYTVPEGHVPVHASVVVNGSVPPVPIEADVGLTATELRAMIVITVTTLCFVTPFRVALTKRPTVPPVVPAVKVGVDVVAPVRLPIAPFESVHEKMVPAAHAPLHNGVAVNPWVPSVFTVALVGLTVTEVNVAGMVMIAELSLVIPLSVTLTNSPTVPARVVPAVNVGEDVVAPVSVPIAPLVRVQV
jgi:hypothetical protein